MISIVFAQIVSADGKTRSIKMKHITSISQEEIEEYLNAQIESSYSINVLSFKKDNKTLVVEWELV